MVDSGTSFNGKAVAWVFAIVGAVVSSLLATWINNVTQDTRDLIRALATMTASVEAHLDGHPGRVEDEVRDLHDDMVNLRADVRVMKNLIEEWERTRGGPP